MSPPIRRNKIHDNKIKPRENGIKQPSCHGILDTMTDVSTNYNSKEHTQCTDICPICERKVEDESAVECDGTCKRWHHISCAELQQGQFNALKATSKKKSKLLWLCSSCEQDFIMFKASKNMQNEMESLRRDMNAKLDDQTL